MIYFVSDVHLGSLVMPDPKAHQEKFIRLLRMMEQDATAVYLLGDIFDFWMEYYWPNERHFRQFEPVLDALAALTKHCPVHFFIGNHDLWTFGWLEKRTGVILHRNPIRATLNGKDCFLAHGDGLGSRNTKFLHLRRIFYNPVPQFFFRLLYPAWGDAFGYRWAASSRRKEMANPELYHGEADEALIRFAKAYCLPDAANTPEVKAWPHLPVPTEKCPDYFIFGHRHIELSLLIPSRACVYIIGDFFRQFTYGVMDDEGIFSIELFEP